MPCRILFEYTVIETMFFRESHATKRRWVGVSGGGRIAKEGAANSSAFLLGVAEDAGAFVELDACIKRPATFHIPVLTS